MITNRFILYLIVIFVGFLTGVVSFRRLATPFRILTFLLLITLVSECFSRVFAYQLSTSMPVYHVFAPIQYALLTCIYSYYLPLRTRVWLLISVLVFSSFAVLNAVYFQDIVTLPSNLLLVSSIFLLPQIFASYFVMFRAGKTQPLFKQGLFWFNTGNLLFQMATFLLWGFHNYLLDNQSLPNELYVLLWFLNIILYSLYVVAIIKGKNAFGGDQSI